MENAKLFDEGGLNVEVTLRSTLVKCSNCMNSVRLLRRNPKLDRRVFIERVETDVPVCVLQALCRA